MTGTYVINEARLGPDQAAALYRALLEWAGRHGDRFVLRLDPSAYDDPDQLKGLTGLGTSRPARVEGIPDDAVGRALSAIGRAFGASDELVQVEGLLGPGVLSELLRDPPPRARGGEISPAEDVLVMKGDRTLYGSYDYAARQMLELEDAELEEVRRELERAGLEPDSIVVVPTTRETP